MAKYRVAALPGDGIGIEVMEATLLVLDRMKLEAEFVMGDIGWKFWCEEGNPLPERTIKMLRESDVCLFGAVTSKPDEAAFSELHPSLKGIGLSYFSPIVQLRQEFDLYTNLRVCKSYPGNPANFRDDINLVIFRENTEGLYAGVEFHPLPEEVKDALLIHPKMKKFETVPAEEIAFSARIMTRHACERILRRAFEYAAKSNLHSVTVVEKANVLRKTGGLFLSAARETAKEYPHIELREANVDAMAMWLLKNPQDYEVLVAENLFGDIISDIAAQLVGGLGFASGGNIGDSYAIFEPVHGSAPKYSGQRKANPIAMLLAARMMLEWLSENEEATRLEAAISDVIKEGKIRTADMGGESSTFDLARAVAERL